MTKTRTNRRVSTLGNIRNIGGTYYAMVYTFTDWQGGRWGYYSHTIESRLHMI